MLKEVLCLALIFFLSELVIGDPPEDPISCSSGNKNCTITNSYGTFPDRAKCHAADVVYPATEQEVISVVAEGTKNRRKMKVGTVYSHSIPKLACPGGSEGLIISTRNLRRIIEFNTVSRTVTLESGVDLRTLIKEAAKVGLALPYTPYWWGLTIGGMLGTGAHGSTLWGNGSAIHDYLKEVTVVSPGTAQEGYAKVRNLNGGHPELEAARVSLGLLGVITKVTLNLEPLFKRSITYEKRSDSDLADQIAKFGELHEFADITWHPSLQQAVYRIDNRVPLSTRGDGLYDAIPFRSTSAAVLAANRIAEEVQELARNDAGKCLVSKLVTSTLQKTAFGLTSNGLLFTGYPVVGYHHRLQASGSCLDSKTNGLRSGCAWDRRLKAEFFHQTTFSIALSKVKSFILDVQQLVRLKPQALCGVDLYNGILIRYVTASSAYLGKEEDAAEFDMTYYRSKDPMVPRLAEDVLEEIEQIAIFKYGALPHWGKNRNVAFEGVVSKYRQSGEFLRVMRMYDPSGLFSNEWTDQMLGLSNGVTILRDGCALEGLCRCSEDRHCAPTKGYFCTEGKVYKNARVCSFVQ